MKLGDLELSVGGRLTADSDRRSSLGISESRYAYLLTLPYHTYLTGAISDFWEQAWPVKRKGTEQPSSGRRAVLSPELSVGGRRTADGGQRPSLVARNVRIPLCLLIYLPYHTIPYLLTLQVPFPCFECKHVR